MLAAAPTISAPSKPLEKYSALVWPKVCSSSGGLAATESASSATRAAMRLTKDSSASDRRPTEPVSR